MKGGIYRADPWLIAPPPRALRPHGLARKKDCYPWGGWGPDLPNRNAGPARGRPARLILGEGDYSGLGVSGSPRGDRQSSPIQGIS